jgi:hypothetical protein
MVQISKAKKKPRKGISRVTNGSRLLPREQSALKHTTVDGRSVWMRRFKDVFRIHVQDLGGDDAVSEAERSICRRAATITTMLEKIEFEMALAEGDVSAFRVDQYQRLSGTLNRLLKTIGLDRKSKDITPTLADYLKQRAAEAIAPDDDEEVQAPHNGHAPQRVRARP